MKKCKGEDFQKMVRSEYIASVELSRPLAWSGHPLHRMWEKGNQVTSELWFLFLLIWLDVRTASAKSSATLPPCKTCLTRAILLT